MLNLLDEIFGVDYAPVAFWVIVAVIALLLLFIILAIVRRARSGTYVAGGRNRKARLSVMDATAIDTHRRLVLVRRDDVEHLLLIGGNSDIVVESDIRLSGQTRRTNVALDTVEEPAPSPAPAPVAAPTPAPVAPPPRPAAPSLATPPAPRPLATPTRPAPSPLATPPRAAPPVRAGIPPAKSKDELDDDLMKELESALDIDDRAPEVASPRPQAKPSLDDEMAKLLGELTSHKR